MLSALQIDAYSKIEKLGEIKIKGLAIVRHMFEEAYDCNAMPYVEMIRDIEKVENAIWGSNEDNYLECALKSLTWNDVEPLIAHLN